MGDGWMKEEESILGDGLNRCERGVGGDGVVG